MTLVALLAPALSALVLGAHFFRAGQWAGVTASLALLALLAIPRPWAARVAQAALLLGGAEWMRTFVQLVAERREANAPYTRLAVILGAVAALTAASALVFESRRLRERYSLR
ncbi:MAG: hypothetical protein ACM3NW_02200 [Syntrophomonadaceae bacterium]